MLIRKFVIAGLVLAGLGLTITISTGVVGQQPTITGKPVSDEEDKAPGKATTKRDTDSPEGSGTVQPSVTDDAIPLTEEKAAAGSSSNAYEDASAEAPRAGVSAAPDEKAAAPRARGKKVATQRPRSGSSPGGVSMGGTTGMRGMAGGAMPGMAGGAMGAGAMPGMNNMPAMGMPGAGGAMAGMLMGGGMMPMPVSEDEHLETWVSRALAEYTQTEDQNARKLQREEISKALDRIFDIRQERRMEDLETLEKRVQRLRGTLETREKLKSDILKNRLDYLIREADGLGWGDGLPAPGRSVPTGSSSGSSSSSNVSSPKRTKTGGTAPRKELEFLAAYPKLFGLSLEMTEPQFLAIAASQNLKAIKNSSDGSTKYLVSTGDGHTVIVMFGKFGGTCGGIQRVRGEVADDGKVEEPSKAPLSDSGDRGDSTKGIGAGSGSSGEGLPADSLEKK